MSEAELFALVKDAAGRFLTPHGTARARFFLERGKLDDAARATTSIKAAVQGQDLAPEIVDLASELVSLEAELDASERRTLLNLVLVSIIALEQGSTRLPLGAGEGGRAYARELLVPIAGGFGEAEAALAAIEKLLSSGRVKTVLGGRDDYRPLVADGGHIYLQRLLRDEERFVKTLARRVLAAQPLTEPEQVARALADVSARVSLGPRGAVLLSEEQAAAVSRAVTRPFTVISGGPGTGKTSIVVSILRLLARLGVPSESIALAAPTGKAANRITESLRRSLETIADPAPEDQNLRAHPPEARTLHRLLGYMPSGDRFLHHENNRLAERVVIVDEGSMIDLVLMERLVRSVRDDARLILLGDAEQLPSVDAGAVLRDIVHDDHSLAVTLKQSFRMDPSDPAGRNILRVARRIREGAVDGLFERHSSDEAITVRERARDVCFSKVELLEGAEPRRELLGRWYLERIENLRDFDRLTRKVYHLEDGQFPEKEREELQALLGHYERARILCITRSALLATGAAAINATMHAKVLEAARFSPVKSEGLFLPGEPILVEKNDYERRLFNGDQGVVVSLRDGLSQPVLAAVFRGESGLVAHPLDALGDEVTLAYAMTVHKAQGSELDDVVVIMPEKDISLVTREILYTALTRSRRSVVISGDRRLFERGVERRIRRYSGVREKLAAELQGEMGRAPAAE